MIEYSIATVQCSNMNGITSHFASNVHVGMELRLETKARVTFLSLADESFFMSLTNTCAASKISLRAA